MSWIEGVNYHLEGYKTRLGMGTYQRVYIEHLQSMLYRGALGRWWARLTGDDQRDLEIRLQNVKEKRQVEREMAQERARIISARQSLENRPADLPEMGDVGEE